MFKILQISPVTFSYGAIAILGGIARYLNSYTKDGSPFSVKVLAASTVVSGFSGYMFALVGLSLSMPEPILFIMAGAGGFFGDQTMKFVMEYVKIKADQ